jgi:hypothetical protein
MANTGLMDVTRTGKAANILEGLPRPLEEAGPFDRIGLMGVDRSRYSQMNAEEVVKLPRGTVGKLIEKFGPSLRNLPFTAEGAPSEDEIILQHELWKALTGEERRSIVDNTTKMASRGRKRFPDQTPYAIRLFYRYMWLKAKDL